MNGTLKITKIGNSAGVILPRDVLAHLNVQVGETLSLVTTSRGIELSAAAPDFEAQMTAAREVMLRRKRALRELAK
ncbi:AbrB/MazE/SpoVT family DNA-binding domain-containing protein [Sphingobium sp. TomTYG45]